MTLMTEFLETMGHSCDNRTKSDLTNRAIDEQKGILGS